MMFTVIWGLKPLQSTDMLFNFIVEVEPQYSGARIEGEEVTLDFVKTMLEDFKNQKTLHKRYVLFWWYST